MSNLIRQTLDELARRVEDPLAKMLSLTGDPQSIQKALALVSGIKSAIQGPIANESELTKSLAHDPASSQSSPSPRS